MYVYTYYIYIYIHMGWIEAKLTNSMGRSPQIGMFHRSTATVRCFPICFGILIWLVVEPPLWKMMEFVTVGMMTFPTYGKKKFMFQTTNQWWYPKARSESTLDATKYKPLVSWISRQLVKRLPSMGRYNANVSEILKNNSQGLFIVLTVDIRLWTMVGF